jgi:hypothetical protein
MRHVELLPIQSLQSTSAGILAARLLASAAPSVQKVRRRYASVSRVARTKGIQRLKACCDAVLCAPVPTAAKGAKAKAVGKFAKTQGISITERAKRLGHARIRIEPSGSIEYECFFSAHRV